RMPVTAEPINKAKVNFNGSVIAGIIKTPPEGTGDPIPHDILKPPPIAAPAVHEMITRSGSTAAKGITPSVIMQSPIGKAILMLFSSSFEYFVCRNNLDKTHEMVTPKGGTIDANTFTASGSCTPSKSIPSANNEATLLTGPPKSKAA